MRSCSLYFLPLFQIIIVVQGAITDGVYINYSNTTLLGDVTIFSLCFTGGNAVNITMTIGDSTVHPPIEYFEDIPASKYSDFDLHCSVGGSELLNLRRVAAGFRLHVRSSYSHLALITARTNTRALLISSY